MSQPIDRRQFQKRLSAALATTAFLPLGCATQGPGGSETPASSGKEIPAGGSGILKVTRGAPVLTVPEVMPEGARWRYGLILPFQAGPTTGGAFVNVRIRNGVMGHKIGHGDYEAGNDVVLFDSVEGVLPGSTLTLHRNHDEPNPHSDPPGQTSIMVKYPMRGGFVPLGAKNASGADHPGVGTGFGISLALARRKKASDHPDGAGFSLEENYQYFEVFQLAFDGERMRQADVERFRSETMVKGWWIYNGGLANAIPSGDDLLLCVSAAAPGGGGSYDPRVPGGSGVLRWSRQGGRWQPDSFVMVTGTDSSSEASLIRDLDGSLLLAARPGPQDFHSVRVWRSRDEGESWEQIIDVRGIISIAPITLNRALDGTPYIASNIYLVPTHPIDQRFRPFQDRQGRVMGGGWTRQKLYLWPLNQERNGLETPILARDCRAEFGPPPGESMWRVDHPFAANLRLADEKWHNVMGYRIHEDVEDHDTVSPPQTGAYLEGVISAGQPIPDWIF